MLLPEIAASEQRSNVVRSSNVCVGAISAFAAALEHKENKATELESWYMYVV